MSIRNKKRVQKVESKEPRSPKKHWMPTWDNLPSNKDESVKEPSPFGGTFVSQKKSVPLKFTMWASSLQINPDIFQDESLNNLIKAKDSYAFHVFVTLLNDPKYMSNHMKWADFIVNEKEYRTEFIHMLG